ncbi:hypothetical protein CDD80_761 [Ophiocordyceps camponoti-rufipedis]|uniref:TUG ubiquitin-like domain-containing protein n=1 Tax=Ophiocordyceps camponoti-rufipedis TaxID=2004952 RepID=A0A2C5XNK6_9HYPO|nr:hypothetical protein CDD80_761 [Ophiocordyceps camponoti-rufipedis]
MSAHVVVIAADLRRATVKVSPGTYLVDVLEQGCTKLRLSSDKYTLKRQKQVDLSVPYRTSGLLPGAKLELVQKAKTPSVVQVALQLPGEGGRLVRKFPADLTLWKMLRQFEADDAGGKLNLTACAGGKGGEDGQLYYQSPVLNIMGRELASLEDLQKTLSQLGYNSGSVLVRLAFRSTDLTLVDAMRRMSDFFRELDQKVEGQQDGVKEETRETSAEQPPEPTSKQPQDIEATTSEQPRDTEATTTSEQPRNTAATPTPEQPQDTTTSQAQLPPTTTPNPDQDAYHPLAIFLAPKGSTPAAALRPANEEDFTPTLAHAQLHQARLQESSRNKRLLSDKELADRAAADEARLAAVDSLVVRVRFPDNTSADWRLGPLHSGAFLYRAVKRVMAEGDGRPFRLVLSGGRAVIRDEDGGDNGLVRAYRLSGRVLVNLVWDDAVSGAERKVPFLRADVAERGEAVHVPEPPVLEESTAEEAVPVVRPVEREEKKDGGGKKMPKWLKLGKK